MSVVIIGAGPTGIATAISLLDQGYSGPITLVEQGRILQRRICPVDRGNICSGCGGTCNVLSGIGGGIHYGDSVKLSQLPAGRRLGDLWGARADSAFDQSIRLFERLSGQTVDFVRPGPMALEDNARFKPYPVATVPADTVARFLENGFARLGAASNLQVRLRTQVVDIAEKNGGYELALGLPDGKQERLKADRIVVAVGRSGLFWWREQLRALGIAFSPPVPSVGLRFETDHRFLARASQIHPDFKVTMNTPAGKFKSFCYCGGASGGQIKFTRYKDFCLLDGHVGNKVEASANRAGNFALLYQLPEELCRVDWKPHVTSTYIDPYIALRPDRSGKPVAQTYEDFKSRRCGFSTWTEMKGHLLHTPSVEDLHPARLDSLFADEVHASFCSTFERFTDLTLHDCPDPELVRRRTLVLGLELEGMWDTVHTDINLQTSKNGIYAAGDASGLAQGILQAMASGVVVAEALVDETVARTSRQSKRDRLVYDQYWRSEDHLEASDTFAKMVELLKVETPSPPTIVDLGCGVGRHMVYAARQGARSWGIDHSARALSKARQNSRDLPSATVVQGDFVQWLKESTFGIDGLVCFDALHHISPKEEDILAFIDLCQQRIRTGGYLLLTLLVDIDYGAGGAPDGRLLLTKARGKELLERGLRNHARISVSEKPVHFDRTVNYDPATNALVTTHYRATRLIYLHKLLPK